jgi:hypothetical protein
MISAGNSPRAALAQLMTVGDLRAGRYRLSLDRDRTDLGQGHAEVVMQPPEWQACASCHGGGRHVQNTSTRLCDACAGLGAVKA